mgnify:CR=1 FL=1
MKEKYPLKIIRTENNIFKAATSINKFNDNTKNIRQELSFVEIDYTVTIESVHRLLGFSSKKRVDTHLYWLIGNAILQFFERLSELGFYLIQQNQTIARDIGISKSSISRILSFRKRFPKVSMIDPTIPWAKYRDNKIPLINNDGKV